MHYVAHTLQINIYQNRLSNGVNITYRGNRGTNTNQSTFYNHIIDIIIIIAFIRFLRFGITQYQLSTFMDINQGYKSRL